MVHLETLKEESHLHGQSDKLNRRLGAGTADKGETKIKDTGMCHVRYNAR